MTLTDIDDQLNRLQRRLARETAARVEAERLLEAKSASLFEATERLSAETAQVQRLSLAIDLSADGIAITDADGCYTYMNPMHASMFGYASVEDCLGRPWQEFYEAEVLAIFEREVFPAFSRDGYWRGEATGRAQDGSPVHQNLSLTALPEGGILCSTRDAAIFKRREAQRERLQQLLADAERRDALGRMASSVAHDFANILATINASAKLLETAGPAADQAVLTRRILTSCSQADALVTDLMGFDPKPVREACAVDEVIRDVGEVMVNQFRSGQLLDIAPGTQRLVCETDPTLYARLAANLIKNALEALGPRGHVKVSLERVDADEAVNLPFQPAASFRRGRAAYPAARLVVSDDGSGMPQESLDNAFTPFQSTKGRGRGLGLATVDALLTGQPGRIAVYSRPGEGSFFVLDLPLQETGLDLSPTPRPESAEPVISKGALVVDDDVVQVEFMREAVRMAGWDPVAFTDPVEALKVFKAAPRAFGLVVTDRRMPQMSGDELVRSMLDIRPSTRIVMCSGALQTPLPPGLSGTLAKPALLEDVINLVGPPPARESTEALT